jgi:hypothetical protein
METKKGGFKNVLDSFHQTSWNLVCPTDSNFFGLSRSTRCGYDRKYYCKNLWSLECIFCTLVTMATAAILNFFQPPKSCHSLRWTFLQSFMKLKRGGLNFFWFLSSNIMKHRRNIHSSVWKLLACWSNSKWRTLYSFLSECFVFTSTEKHTWPLKNLLGT